MVGQTGKGLDTDDVLDTLGEKLGHLAGEEPAFAVLIPEGEEGLGQLRDLLDGHGRPEAPALFQRLQRRRAQGADRPDAEPGRGRSGPGLAEKLVLIVVVVDAVVEKVHQVGHHRLGALPLEKVHQAVIGKGHVFHEDFAHNPDPRPAHGFIDGKMVKALDNLAAERGIGLAALAGERGDAALPKLGVQGVGGAGRAFIGADPVQAAQEEVPEDDGFAEGENQGRGEAEALVLFHAVGVERDDGNVREAGLVQGAADEADIIAGPAAAAGLGHDDGEAVGVILAGEHGLHDLAHHRDGGEAGVVVDVAEPGVDGAAVVVGEHHHVVAVAAEDRLEQVEVDRAHLGGEDGIAVLPHPLGKLRPVIGHLPGMRDDVALLPHVHGGEQAADADAGGAEVVDLVDLQDGVELAAVLKDFADLVGGDGVQAAAERVELDELKVLVAGDEFRGGIETRVIDPLVRDADGPLGVEVDGEAVLGEDREAETRDHLGDAVVDLRVDVVGAAGEDDAAAVGGLHLLQHAGAFPADVLLGAKLLRPGAVRRFADVRLRNLPVLSKEGNEAVGGGLLIGHGDEGPEVADLLVRHVLDVVLEVFGVGDDDRAVEVVLGVAGFLVFIEHAGVEDGADAAVDEPLDMPVGELRGVALGFRGDRVHAALIELPGGEGGELQTEAQLPEEHRPEGIVLIDPEHAGNADRAAGRLVRLQRRVGKEPLALEVHQVGGLLHRGLIAEAALTAVPGDVLPAAGEGVDGEEAVVLAAAAVAGLGAVPKVQQFLF